MAGHDPLVLHHVPGVDDELRNVEKNEEADDGEECVDSLFSNSSYGHGLKKIKLSMEIKYFKTT